LNTLGIEDFGIYNIVGSVVIFLSFFKNALTNATSRFLTYELGTGDLPSMKRMFAMSVNIHVILAILMWLIMELVGVWFLNYKLNIAPERMYAANWTFQFSLLAFCADIIKTPYNSTIIAHERMNFYAYISIAEVTLKLLVVYLLMIGDVDKLILYSFLIMCVIIIVAVIYAIYCLRYFQETKYKFCWDSSLFKRLTAFSGWSLVVNAADVIVLQSQSILFNLFGGVTVNAAMGVANQVNTQLNNFLSTFASSFNPQIIKSYAAKEYEYFMKLIFSTSKLSYYLLFSAAFPLAINIDYILKLWLGNPPDLAPVFLKLVMIYSLIDAFSAPLWNAVYATGKLKTHQILMSIIKFLNLPISYIALKSGLPIYIPLLVWGGLNMICSVVRALYMKKLINLPLRRYFINVIGSILLVSILSTPIAYYYKLSHTDSFVSLLVSSLLFFVPYICVVYLIGLNSKERELIKRMLSNIRNRISI
jgi:O-antigen/teichoic acid export membrane protein